MQSMATGRKTAFSQELQFGNQTPTRCGGFCFAIIVLMANKGKYKSVQKGIPALVCIPTGEKVTIDGKIYTVLKLMYDLKGEYMPPATLRV